ncbi:MAG: dipeptidase [Hyphomonadaceae bacterium]
MRTTAWLFALAVAAAPALAAAQAPTRAELARVERILRRTPLVDGHNDIAEQIGEKYGGDPGRVDLMADTSRIDPSLHTDIPRLRAGHVGAQFWSVYVPAALQGPVSGEAVRVQMDIVRRIVARYPRVFEFAATAADIERIHRAGRIASMFGLEGGEAIDSNLAVLREFRASGVLYMTLCHSKTTAWIDSATDAPQHDGLSPFGEEVVHEMNRIGMLVDLSHVSAEAMRDVLRVTQAPVIFSHSSAFALTAHPRNVPDDVLRTVTQNGGVVMVNFNGPFISEPMRLWGAARAGAEAEQRSLHPGDPEAAAAGLAAWDGEHPRPHASVGDLADHVEHIRDVAGVDHVGIGSDYDGVTYLPDGMEGADGYPLLFVELMRRGWSDADLAKLAGGNLLRALRQAERVAARR